ncbi:DNA photolyase FAD-binding protein [Cellulophaga algicola DSM 14237]|uniref:DNA photolyase FAD-binding protein n=1 Tax=Cellulophaga algicola (strain DSM 14237 / IC166 / ACAM 630) TaxID=688270 RepID=E6X7P7_CELAD|nr:FAD-binding domain-containing protein [Cellulophaga algicola]ADV50757.1 DNA photolyase FAD-binding protein [Cellulophaga algicola DSM 14237]
MSSFPNFLNPEFPTDMDAIQKRIAHVDPRKYASSRNYIDGSVSYLSPYLARGVISTKQVYQSLLERGFTISNAEKFIQELAWRDYWQQVWIHKENAIDSDLKHPQPTVENYEIPKIVAEGTTGIIAIDEAISLLYKTGYMHNHLRMYIASIACNVAKSHWKIPAQWMYYHLLDADWASNALSWQWVAGANSNKKYYANQENINRYCHTTQSTTFLDVAYEDFENLSIPEVLTETYIPRLETTLPTSDTLDLVTELPTLIYNYYNLDPMWRKELTANRILLLEPSLFKKFPVSSKSIEFLLELAKNIKGIQVFVGEFDELSSLYNLNHCLYKEHPTNNHYSGIEDSRDWMFAVEGYYPSFFAFWKKCKKEIKNKIAHEA